jgi:two-component system, NarL family, sensor kinase
MKRWNLITRIILTVFLFVVVASNSSLAGVPETKPHGIIAGDSLNILDSLVTNTKVSNNLLSIKYAGRALYLARLVKTDSALANAYKLMGIAYLKTQKDTSVYFFNEALQIANRGGLIKLKIPIIYNLAMLSYAAYNYNDAITLLDSSIMLAKSVDDYRSISLGYVARGHIHFKLHDIKNSKQMYDSAFEVARKDSIYSMMGVALGNLAKFEFEKDTVRALSLIKEALLYLKKERGTEEEMAYNLINMGYWYLNPDSALYFYKSALDIGISANLSKIQIGAYNNMAYSYIEKKDIVKAESCLRDHAIPVALSDQDHDWLSSLYDTYADVCVARNDYKKAFECQRKALQERNIDDRQKASEQVRLLAILLDVKNKELLIQNEAKELLIQKNRLQKTELWLAIALLLVAVSLFVTLVLQQRNRVRLHREQVRSATRVIEMEETEKGRTARELHDLTGQLVMGISGTIENIDFPDSEIKDQIREKINELGKSIRQISHRLNRAMIEHFTFSELISGLCQDVRKLTGMTIHLKISDAIPDLPNELVLHFYRITQELLTNAAKYARDSQVNIWIETDNGKLTLFYSDNGPGFVPEEKSKSSMGIMNIFERTKLINGQASVKSSPGNGTSWEILFPIVQKNAINS